MPTVSLRQIERETIEAAVLQAADDGLLSGKVLDYGAGRCPYRWIVDEVGGVYVAYDQANFPAAVAGGFDALRLPSPSDRFTAILCTQVVQYVPSPQSLFDRLRALLEPEHGWLVMTGPTNWPVVEHEDQSRLTVSGVTRMLVASGFRGVEVKSRAEVRFEDEQWSIGWAARGQA